MTSYLVDAALLVALVVTSVFAAAMYARLKRLGQFNADYERVLAHTDEALQAAGSAVATLTAEGRDVALALAASIDRAEALIRELDARVPAGADQSARPAPGQKG